MRIIIAPAKKMNVERLRDMDLRRNLTPAILAYEGILSGFYGLLRPFGGVTPYRFEPELSNQDRFIFTGEH